MKKTQQQPHLGKLIAGVIEEKGISKAEFSRRVGTSRQNVVLILRKQRLDTELLWKISNALNTNFFHLFSEGYSQANPTHSVKNTSGMIQIQLELSDQKLAQLTTNLVREIIQERQSGTISTKYIHHTP